MLELFHVRESDRIVVNPAALRDAVVALFQAHGFPERDAQIGADVLLLADSRGVDTHGVSNMLRRYLQMADDGLVNPRPEWKIARETPSSATIDCDRGLGIVVLPQVMEIAVEKASKTGVATVLAGNGRHAGMLAYYPMQALDHDMIGYAVTSGGKIMVPTYGGEPRLGTNPHSWAVPAGEMPPFVLDVSSTVVAANKIDLLRRHGSELMPGWAADSDGSPIEEPRLPPDFTWLLPLGSTRENGSQKGYGLGALAQVLTGVLFGGGPELPVERGAGEMNHMVTVTDVAAFSEVAQFKSRMDSFLRYLADTKPMPGADRVVYAGLLEHEESLRRQDGIPLHREVVEWLNRSLTESGLDRIEA